MSQKIYESVNNGNCVIIAVVIVMLQTRDVTRTTTNI